MKYLRWYFPLQWRILAVCSSWPLVIMNHMIIQRLIIDSVFIRLKPKWERLVVKIWSLRILIKHPSHPRKYSFFFFFPWKKLDSELSPQWRESPLWEFWQSVVCVTPLSRANIRCSFSWKVHSGVIEHLSILGNSPEQEKWWRAFIQSRLQH